MTLKLSYLATRGRIVISLLAMAAALATAVLLQSASTGSAILPGSSQPVQRITLSGLAAENPTRKVEVIVQMTRGADPSYGANLIREAGGKVGRQLPIINGFSATLPRSEERRVGKE